MATQRSALRTEFLFEMTADVERQADVGVTPEGHRRIYLVTGGTFAGPRLKGRVLGGGDWLVERDDGARAVDVRVTLITDDGDPIYMLYRGLIHGSPEVMERIAQGEHVDPDQYYLRTAPFFETASRRYSWLNRIIAIGVGRLTRTQVAYTVYAVL